MLSYLPWQLSQRHSRPAGVTLGPNQLGPNQPSESWQQQASRARLVRVSSAGVGSLFAWGGEIGVKDEPLSEKLRQKNGVWFHRFKEATARSY